jgi:hypothetical protein
VDVNLSCAGCSRPGAIRPPAWAGASGHAACLTWLQRDAKPGQALQLLDRPPVIGATYSLLVRHPFRGRIGRSQWVLFEPAGPWRDGWVGHADRLPDLAVALVEPLGFMGQSNDRSGAEYQSGWLRVRVDELILANDLSRAFPADRKSPLGAALSSPWPATETTVVEHGNLSLFEREVTAEIGMWALLHRTALGNPALLAIGAWSFHEASFVAGNRPLSAAETVLFT